jgi:hypothetical protein
VANVRGNGGGAIHTGTLTIRLPGKTGFLAIAAAAGLVAWIAATHHNPRAAVAPVKPLPVVRVLPGTTASRGQSAKSGVIAPVLVTPAQLRTRSSSLGEAIFWLGAAPKYRIELSRTSKGAVIIRYLPDRTKAGARGAALTVITYPLVDAYATAQASIQQAGTSWLKLRGGGLATYVASKPTDVYVAFPGVNYLAEVYAPQAKVAREVVAAGHLQQVP